MGKGDEEYRLLFLEISLVLIIGVKGELGSGKLNR